MKVKTLIKKLQQLGDEYKNAEVTIQNPVFPYPMPLQTKIDTNYCKNLESGNFEVIVILKQRTK